MLFILIHSLKEASFEGFWDVETNNDANLLLFQIWTVQKSETKFQAK